MSRGLSVRGLGVRGLGARALPSTPVVAGLLVVLLGLLVLAQRATVLVHRCVAGDGAAGFLGLRLAFLRTDGACPEGTLAVGPSGTQVLSIVLVVAVPVLVAHLVAGTLGLGVLARARSALGRAAAVVAARFGRVPGPVAPSSLVRTRPVTGASWVPVAAAAALNPWRRGPPVLRLA